MDLVDLESFDLLPEDIIISRITDQLQCNKVKKELGCYFPNKNFIKILKKYRHLLNDNQENTSKKRDRDSSKDTINNEEVKIPIIETSNLFEPLASGFIKCWIINKINRTGENLFHVEFNKCSCDTKFTWEQILDYCNGDENEASNRLILEERPYKPNGLLKKNKV